MTNMEDSTNISAATTTVTATTATGVGVGTDKETHTGEGDNSNDTNQVIIISEETPTIEKTTPRSRKGSSGIKGPRYWQKGGGGSNYKPYGHPISPRQQWNTPSNNYTQWYPPCNQSGPDVLPPHSPDSAAVTQTALNFSVPAGVNRHIENAVTRPCFDWLDLTDAFPRVNPEIDDKALNEALIDRGEALLPSNADIKLVDDLIDIVLTACTTISSSEEAEDKEVRLDEAILVGSYKKKTYLKGKLVNNNNTTIKRTI